VRLLFFLPFILNAQETEGFASCGLIWFKSCCHLDTGLWYGEHRYWSIRPCQLSSSQMASCSFWHRLMIEVSALSLILPPLYWGCMLSFFQAQFVSI